MQSTATQWALFTVLFLFTLPVFAQLEEPPLTIKNKIRPDQPIVNRVYYDDELALYTGGEYTYEDVGWMVDYTKQVWAYMQTTYGDFGDDPRIYVVVHDNPEYGGATISTRWDPGMDYRNAIDLGSSWDWRDSVIRVNYEVITHELAHIVEGSNNNVKESPSFAFWNDGPWPEIFIYDVYVNAIQDSTLAQDWYNFNWTKTNSHQGESEQHFFFRDWFYPLWAMEESAAVFDRYFKLLSTHFRQQPIDDPNVPDSIPTSAFRATKGEVLYFTNLATGTDNKELFTRAFGWNEDREEELYNARYYYGLQDAGATLDFPDYTDITSDTTGEGLSAEHPPSESPATEQLPNLTDDSYLTKWLTGNRSSWVQFGAGREYVVSAYTITSANDAANRDPIDWTLQGSNDGQTWTTIDERFKQDFAVRFYQRLFTFDNDTPYRYYRLNFGTVAAGALQIAEIELLTAPATDGTSTTSAAPALDFAIFPNPAEGTLFLQLPEHYEQPTVRVLSVLGQELFVHRGGLAKGIDISSLPSGTYLLQLEDQGAVGVRKFFKR